MATLKVVTFICLINLFQNVNAASLYPNAVDETSEESTGSILIKNYSKGTAGHTLVSEFKGNVWHELSNAISYGWNNVVSLTGSVTNQSIYAYKHLTEDYVKSPVGMYAVNQTHNENGYDCTDVAACIAWKLLSVVSIALGAGFLISLSIPVFSYGVCTSIGLLLNSMALVKNMCWKPTTNIPARDYHKIFHKLALALLDSMFAVGSILLLWLCIACIIGWILWPYF